MPPSDPTNEPDHEIVIIKVLDVLKEAGVKGNLSAFTEVPK